MKVSERVLKMRFRKSMRTDDMQFRFSPGHGATNVIFIVRELLEKFISQELSTQITPAFSDSFGKIMLDKAN